jgi:hypothetical protein
MATETAELVAACKKLIDRTTWLNRWYVHTTVEPTGESTERMIQECREAIAKAENPA